MKAPHEILSEVFAHIPTQAYFRCGRNGAAQAQGWVSELALVWKDRFGGSQEESAPRRVSTTQLSINIRGCPVFPLVGNSDSEA
jgi:hypothetical protein